MACKYLLLGSLLAALLFACGGDGASQPPDEGSPDPRALLRDAASAAAGLQSLHFRLEHENGTSPLPLGLRLVSAEGNVEVPARLKAAVRARSGNLNIDVDVVSVEGRTWITNPFSRRFQELPGTNLNDILDPVGLLLVFTREIEGVVLAGSQSLDGTDTYRLTGSIDSAALRSVLPAEAGRSIEFELWIGKEDDLPRRIRLKGALTSADAGNIVRRIDFSRFNEKVEITPPP